MSDRDHPWKPGSVSLDGTWYCATCDDAHTEPACPAPTSQTGVVVRLLRLRRLLRR